MDGISFLVKQTVPCVRQFGRLVSFLFLLISVNAHSAAVKWVVLGDSISAGYGISTDSGWVSLLQKQLDDEGHSVQLFNESISGDTTAGGLARLPEILTRIKPHKVIIELGGNDGLRGLSPKAMQKNIEAMVVLCRTHNVNVVLLGMKIPPNYGRKYSALFEAVFTKISQQYNVPLLPFFMEGIGGYEELMQGDRIHPNSDAQIILTNNAWKFLKPLI